MYDYLHPNDAGYVALGRAMSEAIRALLPWCAALLRCEPKKVRLVDVEASSAGAFRARDPWEGQGSPA